MEFKNSWQHLCKHSIVPGWDYYLFSRGSDYNSPESINSLQIYVKAANECAAAPIDNKTVFAYVNKYGIISKFRKIKLKTALGRAKWDFVSYSPNKNRIYTFYPTENIEHIDGCTQLPTEIEADTSRLESLLKK